MLARAFSLLYKIYKTKNNSMCKSFPFFYIPCTFEFASFGF
jgi:hypothetical protein